MHHVHSLVFLAYGTRYTTYEFRTTLRTMEDSDFKKEVFRGGIFMQLTSSVRAAEYDTSSLQTWDIRERPV